MSSERAMAWPVYTGRSVSSDGGLITGVLVPGDRAGRPDAEAMESVVAHLAEVVGVDPADPAWRGTLAWRVDDPDEQYPAGMVHVTVVCRAGLGGVVDVMGCDVGRKVGTMNNEPEYGQRVEGQAGVSGVGRWTYRADDRRHGFKPSEIVGILSRYGDEADVRITPNLRGAVVGIEVKVEGRG